MNELTGELERAKCENKESAEKAVKAQEMLMEKCAKSRKCIQRLQGQVEDFQAQTLQKVKEQRLCITKKATKTKKARVQK